MKKKKIIKVPEEELDMFAKYGVKTIVDGNKVIKLTKTKKMKKINAEEFLKLKGWDEKNPVVGGVFFKGIAELLEEYARLQPFDTNVERFPSQKEIDGFADLYHGGEIYIYAGMDFVRKWMKNHGLIL